MVWEENKKKIEEHNAEYEQGMASFCMGLNEFSDLVSDMGIVNSVVFLFTFSGICWFSMFYLVFHKD